MVVAVDTSFVRKENFERHDAFFFEILNEVCKAESQHQFIFFFNQPYNNAWECPDNVKPVIAGPAASNSLLKKYWLNIKVPALLKKHKADAFVSYGSCSTNTSLPSGLVMDDMFLRDDRDTSRFFQKSKTIATLSAFSKNEIIKDYQVEEDRIRIIPIAAKEIFCPLSEIERLGVKEKFTSGREYFAYTGPFHAQSNLISLLKAFSIFKKRQASNLKLIIAGSSGKTNKSFTESIGAYKYREDVVLVAARSEKERAAIAGAAYAVVDPSLNKSSAIAALETMSCAVPLITATNPLIEEFTQDAVSYINPSDHVDIAEKMMLLYKDESLRDRLIAKGKKIAKSYNWKQSVAAFWKWIQEIS